MSRGGQIAVAVATGYALGRGRRMRWALALAAAAAAGRLTAGREGLTGRLGLLDASPKLGRLIEAGRPLVSAGGAAARTAVGGRIDAAADRLQDTAQRLRGPGRTDDDQARTREPDAEDADYTDEPGDRPRYGGGKGYDDVDRDDDDRDDDDRDDVDGEDREDDDQEDDDRTGAKRRGRARPVESPKPPVRRRGR